MSVEPSGFPKVLTLYLELSQYPILAKKIRERMRQELFKRGVITREEFEQEVLEKAIQSQQREGLIDPFVEEPPDVWLNRQEIVRDNMTDFYFAYNLPHDLFEELVKEVLAKRVSSEEVLLSFHPELAPWDMLFAQGEAYEALPKGERRKVQHHLEEIKVVLIKAMISDHLEYVGIAKQWFDIADLREIRSRRLGRGKIGGKAAGLEMARCILNKSAPPELKERLDIPLSWYIGADVFYRFTQYNDLLDYANQKYRSESEVKRAYPDIRKSFLQGRFPEEIIDGLRGILASVKQSPLIVRSSSLLEDSFGFSFAGKYESHFCPNQGSPEQNLRGLVEAIASVYASVYSPDVLQYRRSVGMLDYDERMAILLQPVQGRGQDGYLIPDAAGVAFSRNQFRWSPVIERSSGFVRMVWGLGTRAVENVGGDYPRLVALSHPELRPETDPKNMRRFSQSKVDLIDLSQNVMRTAPIPEVLSSQTPNLRWLAQRFQDGQLTEFISTPVGLEPEEVVVTFDGVLRRTTFPALMQQLLSLLEGAYERPVDVEFVLHLKERDQGPPEPRLSLLQCRPQSRLESISVRLPTDLPQERVLFSTQHMVPDGRVKGINYLIFVSPEAYQDLAGNQRRVQVAQLVGQLNKRMAGERFILVGPGRWGSDNPELGIPVSYSDIYHAKALVELVHEDASPDPSYGTHFFQDLVESRIYPLAISMEDRGATFNWEFFQHAENHLQDWLPEAQEWEGLVKVIHVPEEAEGQLVRLVMNGDESLALAYLMEEADRVEG